MFKSDPNFCQRRPFLMSPQACELLEKAEQFLCDSQVALVLSGVQAMFCIFFLSSPSSLQVRIHSKE